MRRPCCPATRHLRLPLRRHAHQQRRRQQQHPLPRLARRLVLAPLHLLPEGLAAETLARFPRLDFKRAFVALLASLHDRNPAAAAASAPVADVGERHVHGFRRIHFCDVIAQAGFAE